MPAPPTSADPRQVHALLGGSQAGSPADRVQWIETHISWVFLTDRFAYKLKKPVRFEFLDFSTPALRRQACEDEVRLNRRLAQDVYLEVVPITIDAQGSLSLGGEATQVNSGEATQVNGGEAAPPDWMVKMRRLPADRSLDRLIEAGTVSQEEIDRLGILLSEFFAKAAPVSLPPNEFRCGIERHVRANANELAREEHQFDPVQVQRICGGHLRLLRLRPELFDTRLRDGRVIEGHGDLRPEHVYLENGRAVVIDCLEFSRDLRTLDVADELSFLAMECDRLGAAAIGRRLIEVYQQRTSDRPPAALTAFYKSYRACVRAKVTALRAQQIPPSERTAAAATCQVYLDLADQYAKQILPPILLVVRGLMGSGKSTLAAALADSLGLTMLGTDAVRRELYPPPPQPAEYAAGIYAEADRQRVYEELFARVDRLLAAGSSVVLDGTFLTNALRHQAVETARAVGAVSLIVTCNCPEAITTQRMKKRQAQGDSLSDARPELLADQQRNDEPLPADLPLLSVDTILPLAEHQKAVTSSLAKLLQPGSDHDRITSTGL
ncbi:MAG: AAA family ATPase [Planctomycetes bacterium]|nr:AAA family ATPase [Planctomycetota bacterium]